MDRKKFFDLIKRQVSSGGFPLAAPERPRGIPPAPFEPPLLVDRFTAELEAVSGRFHRAASADQGWHLLLSLFETYEVTDFLAWEDRFLPLPDLNERLQAAGFRRLPTDLPRAPAERESSQKDLAQAQVGLTGALAGLADTGSLVVQNGPGRGRHASLLPQTHIALLTVDRLFPSMAHFIAAHPRALHETSNLVYITGPSRTADIEQTLTLGVHGPKYLHVILLPAATESGSS